MEGLLLKQKIKQHCLEVISNKINSINQALQSATEASNNETKSTAGDKHETAKAMMQLEQEKLSKQLIELQSQYTELEKIDVSTNRQTATKGSLIETDKGWFFIGIGLGKLLIENQIVFAVSEQSPIGKYLMENKINSGFDFNGISYKVKSVQ